LAEVLQDLDKPNNHPDDADGRRVSSRCFENLGLRHRAAIGQRKNLSQEGVFNLERLGLERSQALLASLGGMADNLFDGRVWRLRLSRKNVREPKPPRLLEP